MRRRRGRKILVPLTFHSLNTGGGGSWQRPRGQAAADPGAGAAYAAILHEALFAPNPFFRLRPNIMGRQIAADLVPHFDPSWRPLAARRLWRSNG